MGQNSTYASISCLSILFCSLYLDLVSVSQSSTNHPRHYHRLYDRTYTHLPPIMAPRTLIIDTDPGVDDVLAILLALASPEVDVKLISIVFGNTHAPVAHANLLKIYHQLANEVGTIPTAAARYGGYGDGRTKDQGRTVLAMGGDDPIGGDKAVAAYFVSSGVPHLVAICWRTATHVLTTFQARQRRLVQPLRDTP